MPVRQGKLLFPCAPNPGLQGVFALVPMTAALYGPQKVSPVNARLRSGRAWSEPILSEDGAARIPTLTVSRL
jgi:hypothetical protein